MNQLAELLSSGPLEQQLQQELKDCNEVTERYGLTLTDQQINNILERRAQSLKDTGRIEVDGGILKDIIIAFCDSPYITKENYEETIMELQEIFYYFKGDAMEILSDDELLTSMRRHFDTVCQGSLDYLSGTLLEDLCRNYRMF